MMFMTGADPDEVWPLVRDFHYSRRMPSVALHCFAWRKDGGLFGDYGEPVAAAIYGTPVNRHWPKDALELQRLVRRDDFTGHLSEFVAWSLRWLRANTTSPFVLSYADSGEGHHGGIYQSCGFEYVAYLPTKHWYFIDGCGKKINARSLNSTIGTSNHKDVVRKLPHLTAVPQAPKHLYIKPLRQKLKPLLRRFDWQLLPYPKPNAARPADAPIPIGASKVQPLGAAPNPLQHEELS